MKIILKEYEIKKLIEKHVREFADIKKFPYIRMELLSDEDGKIEAQVEICEIFKA